MTRNPRPPNEMVLTKPNVFIILSQSFVMTSITFVVYMLSIHVGLGNAPTLKQRQSLAFSVLTTIQLTQSFLSKSVLLSVFTTGVTSNIYLIYSFFISFGFLVLGVEVPVINDWLELTSITGVGWLIVFICVLIHFVLIQLVKSLARYIFLSPVEPVRENVIVEVINSNGDK
jgi:Ca2+-transporting ATPase